MAKEAVLLKNLEAKQDYQLATQALASLQAFSSLKNTLSGEPISTTELDKNFGIMIVHETPIPLLVIGEVKNFKDGTIQLQPGSRPNDVIVRCSKTPGFLAGSLIAKFGTLDRFYSYNAEVNDNFFNAMKYSGTNGDGNAGLGYIAPISINKFEIKSGPIDKIATRKIKFAAVFAGFDAAIPNTHKSYHGLIGLDK